MKKDGATSLRLGRIERLDNSLTIDSRSLFNARGSVRDLNCLSKPITRIPIRAMEPHDHGEPLRETYDSALFIVIAPGWHIELFATKLKSEITH